MKIKKIKKIQINKTGIKKKKKPSKRRMQPISMYPLKPEETLKAFMKIDKKKILGDEKKKKDGAFLEA